MNATVPSTGEYMGTFVQSCRERLVVVLQVAAELDCLIGIAVSNAGPEARDAVDVVELMVIGDDKAGERKSRQIEAGRADVEGRGGLSSSGPRRDHGTPLAEGLDLARRLHGRCGGIRAGPGRGQVVHGGAAPVPGDQREREAVARARDPFLRRDLEECEARRGCIDAAPAPTLSATAAFCEAACPVKPGLFVGLCFLRLSGRWRPVRRVPLEVPLSLLSALSVTSQARRRIGESEDGGAN